MIRRVLFLLILFTSLVAQEISDSTKQLETIESKVQLNTVSTSQSTIDKPFEPDARRIALERIKNIKSTESTEDTIQIKSLQKPLTLDDALQRLIIHNESVQKAKMEWQIGQKRNVAAYGIFEPIFTASYNNSSTDRFDVPLTERRESVKTGVEGTLPSSTRYKFSFIQQDIRFAQSSYDVPSVSSAFSITQPLLKNLIGNGPISDVKIARIEKDMGYSRYRTELMNRCYELENTYWKLVYLQEKYRNTEKSVAIAQKIVSDSKTFVASGIMSRLDALEAAAQLAQRKTSLASTRIEHIEAIEELFQMIGLPVDSTALTTVATTPLRETETGHPEYTQISATKIDSLLNLGQPEIHISKYEQELRDVAVSQQRGRALPELNITGSWGISGSNKKINSAWENYTNSDRNEHNWQYALELKFPIGSGVRERSLVSAEKLNLELSKLESKTLQKNLNSQTLLMKYKIHELTSTITNAAVVVEFRASLLKSEAVRMRAGLSNVRKIFELEEELANARQSELEALIDFQMTRSLHDRLLGITLIRWNLESIIEDEPVLHKKLTE